MFNVQFLQFGCKITKYYRHNLLFFGRLTKKVGKNVFKPVAEKQWEIQKIAIHLDIKHGEANPETWIIFLVILNQALAINIILGLDFYGYDFQTMLNEEVHFGLVALNCPGR